MRTHCKTTMSLWTEVTVEETRASHRHLRPLVLYLDLTEGLDVGDTSTRRKVTSSSAEYDYLRNPRVERDKTWDHKRNPTHRQTQ